MQVALRKESVDRNHYGWSWYDDFTVALRKESVDRNAQRPGYHETFFVALRKESVDRNLGDNPKIYVRYGSLSARRAWIEIFLSKIIRYQSRGSLSARRAWIEISYVDLVPVNYKSRSPQGERG